MVRSVVPPRRWRGGLTAILVVMLVQVLVLSTSVDAHHDGLPAQGTDDCAHGGNWESTACLLYSGPYYGVYVAFNNNTMYIDPSYEAAGQHINHTLWVYSNSPCSPFVELGYTHGFYGMTGYRWYQGYWDGVLNDNPVAYPYNATTNDGSPHTYWVRYDGNRQFSLLLDGYVIPGAVYGAAQNQGYGGCKAGAGIEVSRTPGYPPSSAFWSDTFDLLNMKYGKPDGTWWLWPASYSYIYYPCGSYPVGQCFNGTYYGDGHWADNKPH